jgi:hypothetical protein
MSDGRVEVEATVDAEALARREFLKKGAKIAVTAPAVALLLSASAKSAWAKGGYCPSPKRVFKPKLPIWWNYKKH